LGQLTHPQTGAPLLDRVIYGSDVTHGPHADQAPDLHLIFDGYRCIAFPLFATNNQVITQQIRGDSGCHRSSGIFIGQGPAFRQKLTVEGSRIVDLAPTILHLLSQPVPEEMDGVVLGDALSPDLPPVRYARSEGGPDGPETALSEEDTAEIEDRLRALGYLG
jgi:predicted AlkP superfamily phosphohydrolase/phosphomutase